MDSRNCQTSTVAPAEPGVFPFVIIRARLPRFDEGPNRLSVLDRLDFDIAELDLAAASIVLQANHS
jgi:hypothetical protein